MQETARRILLDRLKRVIPKDENFYKLLSCSRFVRYNDICEDKTAAWDWAALSANPGITLQDIVSHPDDPWVWAANPWIVRGGRSVSSNPGICFSDVMNHLDKPWRWGELSANVTLTIDIVLQLSEKPWDWYNLSMNRGIPWSDVQRHPDLPWNYEALSRKPGNDDEQCMLANYDKLSWGFVSENVSLDIIKAHMDWPWNWESVCRNPNVPFDAFPHLMNSDYFPEWSLNPSTTLKNILPQNHCHPGDDWNWDYLRGLDGWLWTYLSESIDFQDIIQHLYLPWHFGHMSRNKSLRLDYVAGNQDQPWNYRCIASNSYTHEYQEILENVMRQHMAAYKIQVYWRKCISNHKYSICHTLQLKRIQ